jgi:two-component system chemotaxis sensor kinase CheA
MSAASDRDSSFIAESLPIFIGEAQEQIESIEQLLLQLEDAPGDRELLDALFRCAHTVKGSAGIFGLHRVVAFTHHVESLLDRLREGAGRLHAALGTLLLRCNDEIRALVSSAGQDDDGRRQPRRCRPRRAGGPAAGPVPAPDARCRPRNRHRRRRRRAAGTASPSPRRALRRRDLPQRHGPAGHPELPGPAGHGDRTTRPRAVPTLDQMDPETCHLGFELQLEADTTRAQIEAAFSFVRDDCQLYVMEPGATPQDYVRLIEALPDLPRLGDILVDVGAISRIQLQQALQAQHQRRQPDGRQPAWARCWKPSAASARRW